MRILNDYLLTDNQKSIITFICPDECLKDLMYCLAKYYAVLYVYLTISKINVIFLLKYVLILELDFFKAKFYSNGFIFENI